MCIIIYTPDGRIPTGELKTSLSNNSHGWGLAVAAGDELVVEKGMSKRHFWRTWKSIESLFPGCPVMFHARITTQGKTNVDNCHPFPVAENWVMAHNGMISGFGDNDISDTNELAQIIYECGLDTFLKPGGKRILKEIIGWSKLCFLSADGQVDFVNEDKGHWANGRWYANYSYRPTYGYTVAKTTSTVVPCYTAHTPAVVDSPHNQPLYTAAELAEIRDTGTLKEHTDPLWNRKDEEDWEPVSRNLLSDWPPAPKKTTPVVKRYKSKVTAPRFGTTLVKRPNSTIVGFH